MALVVQDLKLLGSSRKSEINYRIKLDIKIILIAI